MTTKTRHNDENLVKPQTENVVRLAAFTKEATFYRVGTETEVRYQALIVEFTAKVANDILAVAAQDAIETN